MPAKTHAEAPSTPKGRQSRRHEISGILLLAGGVFAGLSLVSMHLGRDPLMGPGGSAVARGLSGLAGVAAYLLVAGMLVAAVRCFRSRPVVDGVREGTGVVLLLGALATLLYLPFAGGDVVQHGPGGALGEWLGELAASVIGPGGAAPLGPTMLVVSILLVTEISMREAAVVLAWAGRHASHGIVVGAK